MPATIALTKVIVSEARSAPKYEVFTSGPPFTEIFIIKQYVLVSI